MGARRNLIWATQENMKVQKIFYGIDDRRVKRIVMNRKQNKK